MKERIFISYKRDDKDIVFKIKDDIEKNVGEMCWIDLDDIKCDANYFVDVITKSIDEADIFLFMYYRYVYHSCRYYSTVKRIQRI